ncbi:flocculation protein FLO11-like [Leguminivora glycinivorella]|uniref:flocculation protein FLO11-like n=1 Tax=Leguminivora glycinivorella TaxID=1035111 RepID=UPI00200E15ED|nr:flocculation protein FLO11-like [Leguminivora glycinivorella]
MVCRNIGDDDSSDSDTARGEDDDVAIVEKSLVTIDLSEDNKEEDKNKDAALTSESVGHKTKIKHEGMAVDVTGKASGKPTVNLHKAKTNKNDEKSSKTKKSKQIDKTIDKNKEIVDLDAPELNKIDKSIDKDKEIIDLDAPSPDTDVLEALNKLDVNNVITTISFDSDEDDAKNDKDNDSLKNAKTNEKDLEVPGELASTHEKGNESQKNKAEKRRQRESSDSSNGNLVIDDGIDYESSDNDYPILRRKSSDENTKKIKYNMYDNRRFHEYTPNVYRNRKKRRKKNDKSVTKNIKETDSDVIKEDTNVVEEESSSDDGSRSNDSSEENDEEEETSIDPKLLMYAVVVLERICALPTSKPSTETLRSPSPEYLSIKTEQPSSPVGPTSPSNQLLLRITPSPPISSPLLSRLTPSPLDPPPMVSESISSEIPPSCPSLSNLPRFSSNTPPPLAEISPPLSEIPPPLSEIPPPLKPPSPLIFTPEPDSLLHFFASTLPPEFVFNKHNLPLLRECKFCSVPLQRVDAEKGKMGNRVAKKIELPDIEEVRRNNRSMLTAQVAPRRARRRSDSTPSPSSGSDSDWTPGAGRARRAASGDARQQTPDGEGPERPYSDGSSSESEGMPADGFDSDEDLISVVRRRNADGSEFRKLKCRRRVNEADLKRVLDDLAGIEGDKDCTHIKCTSMRGPAAAVLSSNCANCAARVLSAPPISGHEARLQRQLLRRAARMARVPVPTPTTSTATTAVPAIVVATASTTAHTEVTTKASEMKPRSKKSKKRPHSPSRPRAPPFPVDAEAAAREWLRQKNIAAEKFGVKPRSYKKVAPVVQDSAPATIQPITEANNDTAPKPPLKQNEFTILLTNQMGGATVMPLTEANLSKAGLDSTSAFKPSTSTAPTLFNPSAVANINKKLGALAPSLDFVPIKPAVDKIQTTNANVHIRTVPLMTTTKNNEGFQPLITNVQSLACLPKTPCMVAQARSMPDLNEFTVVNKKDTNNTKSIIIIPAPKSQKKQEGRCKDTENLPQLVNVAGGVSLPSKQGQALHLVVSQSPQKNSVLNQPSTSQQNTVFKNVTKHIYYQPNVSKPNVLNYQPNASTSQTTVLNYQQIASTSQNTGLNYQPNTSVSQNTVLNYQQNTSVSQNTVLNYQSNTKNTVLNFQPSIIVSGSIIQGIEARPKTATSRPYLVTSGQRPPLILNSVLAGQSTQQFRLLNSTQMCAVPQASTVVTASQPSMLFSSMPGHALNATPMLVRSVHAGPPAPHRPPGAPPAADAARQHPASDEDTADGSEIIMSSRLDWSQPPLSSAAWCRGRDSTTLAVLCTGRVCFIRADRQNYLLVSEEEQPPAEAEYWSLRPRVRLTLPGNEGESEVEPAAKRAKTGSNPAPEPAAAKPSYLKVRAFARLAPDPDKARKFSENPAQGAERPPTEADRPPNEAEKPDKFLAPARVFVNNLIYQKMSDEPLVYAKLLVAVPSTKACRALLTRGKPIQMYCLKTGKLYPLEAEPKNDVSRITLTGDEEISGALLALAKRLYNPYDEVDLEQDSDGSPDKDITEVRNTAGRMINAIENTTKLSSKTRQGHSSRGHSSQGHSSQGHSIQGHSSQSSKEPGKPQDAHAVLLNMLSNKTINTLQSGGPTVTTATKVNTKPNDVIELSDED